MAAAVAIATSRLDLFPLTTEALDALIAGDRGALEAATGATFPEPLRAPPLMEDALPFFRDLVREGKAGNFGPFLLVLRETGEAVGAAGFTGAPDEDGVVLLGYSVYPTFQGQGLAAEAGRALVAWALARPEIRRVRATIPPDHVASQRVAAAAGLRRTGRGAMNEDAGLVDVWESA
jgi:RimJ/RimL family protein N-acetyltransferase